MYVYLQKPSMPLNPSTKASSVLRFCRRRSVQSPSRRRPSLCLLSRHRQFHRAHALLPTTTPSRLARLCPGHRRASAQSRRRTSSLLYYGRRKEPSPLLHHRTNPDQRRQASEGVFIPAAAAVDSPCSSPPASRRRCCSQPIECGRSLSCLLIY